MNIQNLHLSGTDAVRIVAVIATLALAIIFFKVELHEKVMVAPAIGFCVIVTLLTFRRADDVHQVCHWVAKGYGSTDWNVGYNALQSEAIHLGIYVGAVWYKTRRRK